MSINDTSPGVARFNRFFPYFRGGRRELIYIILSLDLNVDLSGGKQGFVINNIGSQLPDGGDYKRISRYLAEMKCNERFFNFFDESNFHSFMINREVDDLFAKNKVISSVVNSSRNFCFSARDRFIFAVDYLPNNVGDKNNYMEAYKMDFDKVCDEISYLKWFNGDDAKLDAANSYFSRLDGLSYKKIRGMDDLQIRFCSDLSNMGYMALSFKKIQSLYNNRKSKSSEYHKQCNLSLSVSSSEKIDLFARRSNMTRSQVVDYVFRELKSIKSFSDDF